MSRSSDAPERVDAVVIGAGFAGMYMLHLLREAGLAVHGFEAAGGVGGTWYWNRYPGARCDSEAMYYSYSFLPELEREWPLTERYPTQPEILRYLEHVADRLDLRRDFTFDTRVDRIVLDPSSQRWTVGTEDGARVSATHVITAVGGFSAANVPQLEGAESFEGELYHTAKWPHEPVSFAGKRVGLIGTGASGIQALPVIAAEAEHVTVFQRTPQYTIPARNGPLDEQFASLWKANYPEWRRRGRRSRSGIPYPPGELSALDVPEETRTAAYEVAWATGGARFGAAFNDLLRDEQANGTVADFIRTKIDEIVDDPEVAETLKPYSYPFGAKRVPLDTDYYATFNRANVRLVDLRKHPIRRLVPTGLQSGEEEHALDAIVLATGFDVLTGPLLAIDIRGRGGASLGEAWADGPCTYLGLAVPGFPNLFTITGPGSPSVLTNVPVAIEQHVEWIAECIGYLRENGIARIEATEAAAAQWTQHVQEVVGQTLHARADSWYVGANIPGKPRVFLPYVGGCAAYGRKCDEVAAAGYEGFALEPEPLARSRQVSSSVPSGEVTVEGFRARRRRPGAPGPAPVEMRERQLGTGDAGTFPVRILVPGAQPTGVVVLYHAGGWVAGGLDESEPLGRLLAAATGCAIVAVGYRRAPEHRYPTAVDDAWEALCWAGDHLDELATAGARLILFGEEAGGNLAAVVARRAGRTADGPQVDLQVLVCPIADCDADSTSYREAGRRLVRTRDELTWCWDQYVPDVAARQHPDASPLQAYDLEGVPPTVVVTAERDVLRDEGELYATRLLQAGVQVRHRRFAGEVQLPGAREVLSYAADAIRGCVEVAEYAT